MTEPSGGTTVAGKDGMIATMATSIRRERERAGISASELARRAGIAKSTLSQIEAGTGNPSIETLWALAVALGVPVSRLIEPPQPPVRVVRANEGPTTQSGHADYAARLLASCPPGARRDLFTIRVQPGPAHLSEPHPPGTREHVILCSGRARLGPTGEPVELGAGDYAAYSADVRHVFEALEPDTTAVMIIEQT
jgi:transcriptional regulator with XRE-family HTH domain